MNVRMYLTLVLFAWCFLGSQSQAQSLLERLEKKVGEAVAEAKPVEEQAPPGFLGLTADDQNGLLEVVSVRAGGPADQAGIKPGDRILSAGGVELKRLSDMASVVGKLPAGARVDFVLARDGRSIKIPVVLAERAAEPVTPAEALPVPRNALPPVPMNEAEEPLDLEIGPAQLGVRAEPVTPDLQRAYGLTVRRGAVIQSIVEGSPADRFGLPLGGAIVAVDGGRVDSPEDLAALIGSARPGDTVEISYYLRDQAYRKRVRLVPSNVAMVPPDGTPTDRPLLRKLERAIDGAIAPAAPPTGNPTAQFQAMQAQIEELQARLADLEQRLKNLEAKKTPPPPAPQLPAPLKP